MVISLLDDHPVFTHPIALLAMSAIVFSLLALPMRAWRLRSASSYNLSAQAAAQAQASNKAQSVPDSLEKPEGAENKTALELKKDTESVAVVEGVAEDDKVASSPVNGEFPESESSEQAAKKKRTKERRKRGKKAAGGAQYLRVPDDNASLSSSGGESAPRTPIDESMPAADSAEPQAREDDNAENMFPRESDSPQHVELPALSIDKVEDSAHVADGDNEATPSPPDIVDAGPSTSPLASPVQTGLLLTNVDINDSTSSIISPSEPTPVAPSSPAPHTLERRRSSSANSGSSTPPPPESPVSTTFTSTSASLPTPPSMMNSADLPPSKDADDHSADTSDEIDGEVRIRPSATWPEIVVHGQPEVSEQLGLTASVSVPADWDSTLDWRPSESASPVKASPPAPEPVHVPVSASASDVSEPELEPASVSAPTPTAAATPAPTNARHRSRSRKNNRSPPPHARSPPPPRFSRSPPPSTLDPTLIFPSLNSVPPPNASMATQIASLKGALEAARLREDKSRAEAEAARRECETLKWRWSEETRIWRSRDAELQAHIVHLMHQVQSMQAQSPHTHQQASSVPYMSPTSATTSQSGGYLPTFSPYGQPHSQQGFPTQPYVYPGSQPHSRAGSPQPPFAFPASSQGYEMYEAPSMLGAYGGAEVASAILKRPDNMSEDGWVGGPTSSSESLGRDDGTKVRRVGGRGGGWAPQSGVDLTVPHAEAEEDNERTPGLDLKFASVGGLAYSES
ncbi:hypothetical protein BOTBODRAFT_177922 [Botryobasidium botryosum FD-172 SS1]|uniref:Uncharacterized protein n=1 Tax=Botryobasidium botryosum (strain FD-172 SS1) TaxID=930990 RepID=A0A067MGD0_BOTB1|nr:hypothetical protein BOTBODRAFT_177922 [Botryobasidium botryosum FD-172 SS1]